MIDDLFDHARQTFDHVRYGHSTFSEKLEVGAEAIVGIGALAVLAKLGFSRFAQEAVAKTVAKTNAALPALKIANVVEELAPKEEVAKPNLQELESPSKLAAIKAGHEEFPHSPQLAQLASKYYSYTHHGGPDLLAEETAKLYGARTFPLNKEARLLYEKDFLHRVHDREPLTAEEASLLKPMTSRLCLIGKALN